MCSKPRAQGRGGEKKAAHGDFPHAYLSDTYVVYDELEPGHEEDGDDHAEQDEEHGYGHDDPWNSETKLSGRAAPPPDPTPEAEEDDAEQKTLQAVETHFEQLRAKRTKKLDCRPVKAKRRLLEPTRLDCFAEQTTENCTATLQRSSILQQESVT